MARAAGADRQEDGKQGETPGAPGRRDPPGARASRCFPAGRRQPGPSPGPPLPLWVTLVELFTPETRLFPCKVSARASFPPEGGWEGQWASAYSRRPVIALVPAGMQPRGPRPLEWTVLVIRHCGTGTGHRAGSASGPCVLGSDPAPDPASGEESDQVSPAAGPGMATPHCPLWRQVSRSYLPRSGWVGTATSGRPPWETTHLTTDTPMVTSRQQRWGYGARERTVFSVKAAGQIATQVKPRDEAWHPLSTTPTRGAHSRRIRDPKMKDKRSGFWKRPGEPLLVTGIGKRFFNGTHQVPPREDTRQ